MKKEKGGMIKYIVILHLNNSKAKPICFLCIFGV